MNKIVLAVLLLTPTLSGGADGPDVTARLENAFRQHGAPGLLSAAQAVQREHGPGATTEALLDLLWSMGEPKCVAAAHVLGRMGEVGKAALPDLALALPKARLGERLRELGPGDIPLWLVEAAVSADDSWRSDYWQALECLQSHDERLVSKLIEALALPDLDLRWRSVDLLGDMRSNAAAAHAALAGLLSDESMECPPDSVFTPAKVRARAAYALGCIGAKPEETVALLTAKLRHRDPEIRTWAALGLGRMGTQAKAAIPALIEALADQDHVLESAMCAHSARPDHPAATALVNVGEPSIPALTQALHSPQPAVRLHAAQALQYFGPQGKSAEEALIQTLDDQDPKVRRQAVYTIGSVMTDKGHLSSTLMRRLQDVDPDVRSAAANTLIYVGATAVPAERWLSLLDDPAPSVRVAGLIALRRFGQAEMLQRALERLQNDPDYTVRREVSEAGDWLTKNSRGKE